MKLMVDIDIPSPSNKIRHEDPIMLIGSNALQSILGTSCWKINFVCCRIQMEFYLIQNLFHEV